MKTDKAKKSPGFLKALKLRRAKKGSVVLIAGLLMTSATLRLLSSATDVMAAEDPAPLPLPEKVAEEMMAPKDTPIAEAVPKPPERAEIPSLLESLRLREERVAKRETQIAVREKAMDVARVEIERRLEVLKKTEMQLRATLSRADTAAEDDVARLTTVYESMKPKDAAALFEEMEPDFAAGFLGRMRPDAAANILAGLDPQTAYTISVILAGRNARAPKT